MNLPRYASPALQASRSLRSCRGAWRSGEGLAGGVAKGANLPVSGGCAAGQFTNFEGFRGCNEEHHVTRGAVAAAPWPSPICPAGNLRGEAPRPVRAPISGRSALDFPRPCFLRRPVRLDFRSPHPGPKSRGLRAPDWHLWGRPAGTPAGEQGRHRAYIRRYSVQVERASAAVQVRGLARAYQALVSAGERPCPRTSGERSRSGTVGARPTGDGISSSITRVEHAGAAPRPGCGDRLRLRRVGMPTSRSHGLLTSTSSPRSAGQGHHDQAGRAPDSGGGRPRIKINEVGTGRLFMDPKGVSSVLRGTRCQRHTRTKPHAGRVARHLHDEIGLADLRILNERQAGRVDAGRGHMPTEQLAARSTGPSAIRASRAAKCQSLCRADYAGPARRSTGSEPVFDTPKGAPASSSPPRSKSGAVERIEVDGQIAARGPSDLAVRPRGARGVLPAAPRHCGRATCWPPPPWPRMQGQV